MNNNQSAKTKIKAAVNSAIDSAPMRSFRKANNPVTTTNTERNRRRRQRQTQRKNGGGGQPTQIGKGLREAGGFLGGLFGLGNIGKAAGAGISRIFGQGDYVTNAPMKNSLMGGIPSFSPLTSGFRIQHREYVTDLKSSINFKSQVYSINPGVSTLFPWLSQVALNFEEYKIHGMVVYLNTMAGASVGGTNNALGLWGVVTQYDPSEPDFTNKQQAEAYVGAQSSVPTQSLLHGIECAPKSNVLDKMYVRKGLLPGDDLKFYDWGKIQVFTQGSQSENTVGELWVSYDIEFTKPRLPTGGYSVLTDRYKLNVPAAASTTIPFPTGYTYNPEGGSSLGSSINSTNGVITIPASAPIGTYLIFDIWGFGVGTTTATMDFTAATAGINFRQPWYNTASVNQNVPTTESSNKRVVMAMFQKTTLTEEQIYLRANVAFGTISLMHDIMITQVNSTAWQSPDVPKNLTLAEEETILFRKMIAKFKKEGFFEQLLEDEKEEEEDQSQHDVRAESPVPERREENVQASLQDFHNLTLVRADETVDTVHVGDTTNVDRH